MEKHGSCLGGRDFSYDHWDDFMSSIIRPDRLVDVEPFVQSETEGTFLKQNDLVPPQTQAEFSRLKTRPAWYLVEVSYGKPGVHWIDGGVAVVQKWHAVHADRDSVAFHGALEAAAAATDISRAAVDSNGQACTSLERVGVSDLIPTWDPSCDSSELGFKTFEYDRSIPWTNILEDLEWIGEAKSGGL